VQSLNAIHDAIVIAKAEKAKLEKELASLQTATATAEQSYDIAIKTQKLVQEAAQLTLSNISVRINTIVTKALKAVFPDPYEFNLEFRILYGKLATEMYLERDGKRYNLRNDNGDGIVDVVALALRVAVLCLDKRKLRRLLILDEPCGAVSVNLQPYLGKMLEHLSETLSLQVLMIAAHGSNMQIESAKYFNAEEFVEGITL